MAEKIILDQAEPTLRPGASEYRLVRLEIDLGLVPTMPDQPMSTDPNNAYVRVGVLGDNGVTKYYFLAQGQDAVTLIQQLNTMSFTTTSLQRRIMNMLVQQGHLTGTVSTDPSSSPTGAEKKSRKKRSKKS